MTEPYYQDHLVTLYCGDCRDIPQWTLANALVVDPPYGRNWRQGALRGHSSPHNGSPIAGDTDTAIRDAILRMWGTRTGIVFGDLMQPCPQGTKLVAVYRKPADAGLRGAVAGIRRDIEALYFIGTWPSGLGGRSAVFTTRVGAAGNPYGPAARHGHPHAKPGDLMETLIALTPDGATVADPCAGSGSTLVAARNLGRHAIGVELDERYCEMAARRLAQPTLPLEVSDDHDRYETPEARPLPLGVEGYEIARRA